MSIQTRFWQRQCNVLVAQLRYQQDVSYQSVE